MKKIYDEFVDSSNNRKYRYRIGKKEASSLSGFIAGVVFSSVFWVAVVYVLVIMDSFF